MKIYKIENTCKISETLESDEYGYFKVNSYVHRYIFIIV